MVPVRLPQNPQPSVVALTLSLQRNPGSSLNPTLSCAQDCAACNVHMGPASMGRALRTPSRRAAWRLTAWWGRPADRSASKRNTQPTSVSALAEAINTIKGRRISGVGPPWGGGWGGGLDSTRGICTPVQQHAISLLPIREYLSCCDCFDLSFAKHLMSNPSWRPDRRFKICHNIRHSLPLTIQSINTKPQPQSLQGGAENLYKGSRWVRTGLSKNTLQRRPRMSGAA